MPGMNALTKALTEWTNRNGDLILQKFNTVFGGIFDNFNALMTGLLTGDDAQVDASLGAIWDKLTTLWKKGVDLIINGVLGIFFVIAHKVENIFISAFQNVANNLVPQFTQAIKNSLGFGGEGKKQKQQFTLALEKDENGKLVPKKEKSGPQIDYSAILNTGSEAINKTLSTAAKIRESIFSQIPNKTEQPVPARHQPGTGPAPDEAEKGINETIEQITMEASGGNKKVAGMIDFAVKDWLEGQQQKQITPEKAQELNGIIDKFGIVLKGVMPSLIPDFRGIVPWRNRQDKIQTPVQNNASQSNVNNNNFYVDGSKNPLQTARAIKQALQNPMAQTMQTGSAGVIR